jgi:hypothetical protein
VQGPQMRTSIGLLFVLLAFAPPLSAQALFADDFEGSGDFFEPFTWLGDHAATIDHSNSMGDVDHVGTTVWWNEDNWEARGDVGYLPTAKPSFPGIGVVTGYHIDIHKALTGDPRDGREDNEALIVGGDGSRGVAAMRLDYQGISSARLRNPMLVAEARPGVVEFYAPKFVTTAHWWEISLTPADRVIGGENTAVPAQVAKRPFEDSLNFVAIGHDDIPCDSGWHATFDVHRSIGGVEEDAPMNLPQIEDYPVIDPAQKLVLVHWKLEFRPSGVELYGDLDGDGADEHLYHYALGVPWPEVNVHLLGVAYQADHHPQDGACYQGLSRELVWRDVRVGPVKYARTSIAPRNTVLENVRRAQGWLGFDTRDIQRFGGAVNGAPQPNPWEYIPYGDMAFASLDLRVFGHAQPPAASKTLAVDLRADQAGAARAQLVYDIKGTGAASLYVNGQFVGALPATRTLAYFAGFDAGDNLLFEYAHRSIDIPAGLLHAGANQLRIEMSGEIVMDRLHLEFDHR